MIAGCLVLSWLAAAEPPEPRPGSTPQRPETVAAVVDGEPILARDVERELAVAFRSRSYDPSARPVLLARMLEHLIGRQLILRRLSEWKQAATPSDVNQAMEQVRARLAQRGMPLGDYLAQHQYRDESELHRSLSWQIGWSRFLDRQRTDANLEKYFQRHRRDYDGTRVRVAHILFRADPADAAACDAARDKARQLVERIRTAEVSFADAARESSDGPTRADGGDIGWIGRREPMPESFTRAAFALEPGQVSEPTLTSFGVHLIQCLEIRGGQKSWQEVRAELEHAFARYLFDWLVDQARPQARVEYTPGFPHFRPGTEELEAGAQGAPD